MDDAPCAVDVRRLSRRHLIAYVVWFLRIEEYVDRTLQVAKRTLTMVLIQYSSYNGEVDRSWEFMKLPD